MQSSNSAMWNKLLSNDLSQEANKKSTEVSGFLSGERERESFNQQAGSIAKVNQEALISERSWFLESRHKIKGIIIKEKWMNEQTESKATFKLNEISI